MHRILFYEGKYYFLSNFSSFAVWHNGFYMTAEHAYQAEKFTVENHKIRIKVTKALSAYDAKRIAHENKKFIRSDWSEELKLKVMERILRCKLEMHPYIQEKLIESGDRELTEDSPVDDFWGRGPFYNGQNHLGKIWMKLREELQAECLKKS